jgi:hypothetical protein
MIYRIHGTTHDTLLPFIRTLITAAKRHPLPLYNDRSSVLDQLLFMAYMWDALMSNLVR